MYWESLGFTEPPFALTPNPDFLFMSTYHQEAFAHLLYAIDTRAGFIELSGEVGTGKTTIIRTLLEQLSPETHRSAFIFNPTISPLGLLQEINREFGLTSTSIETHELHKELNGFLLRENRAGHTVVLVIDEAQNLSPEVLEQVRLISNLETAQAKLIQIVLVGQPELQRLLARRELRQLAQRITVRYHLRPMESTDVHTYIRHRIKIAAKGREPVTFTSGAVKRICRFSGGLPRLINAVCDRSLLLAYTLGSPEITAAMATKSIADVIQEVRPRSYGLRHAVIAALVVVAIAASGIAVISYSNKQLPQQNSELRAKIPEESRTLNQPEDANGVKVLQGLLKTAGHFAGTPDGIFDSSTESGVRSFQQTEGLIVDGKPGGKTLMSLYQRTGGTFPTAPRDNRQNNVVEDPR